LKVDSFPFYIIEHALELGFAGGVVFAGGGGGVGGGVDFAPKIRAKKLGCEAAGVSFLVESVVGFDALGLASVFVAGPRKLPRTPSTGREPIV
jgi:hypothetical protein